MLNVKVFNQEGAEVKDLELNEAVFGIEPHKQAMFDMVLLQRASLRQGTHKVKNRTEVAGGGRKPWRQKGTGRARQGSIRAPQWIKGGVVFAPKPRDYRMSIPKSMRRVAMLSALTSKVQNDEMVVLDSLTLEAPKTKEVVKMLNAFNAKKTLIITAEANETVYKSARNIEGVAVLPVNNINVYDLLKYPKVIMTKDAVSKIEEVYA